MALSRRAFTTGAAVVSAGAALALFFGWKTFFPQGGGSGGGDASGLMAPGALPDMALGAADAPVTIVEYASMTCPHCASFHEHVYPALKEKYIDTGRARFIFREFPLDDLALFAAMLARCAPEAKFFPLLDVLFERQRTWASRDAKPVDELFAIARSAGFTEAQFNQCRENEEVAAGIRDTKERAASQFEVRGTPSFFVNGVPLQGNGLEDFDAAIAAAGG